ncbi:MAG: hypothetical protein IID43_02365 [Planctomycetes bacterium]|nr:hypothetical protein [Planctomycetota bacterium]
MIRRAIIVVLTLAALGTTAAWVDSGSVHAEDDGQTGVAYTVVARKYGFAEPTDPNGWNWLEVGVDGGRFYLSCYDFKTPPRDVYNWYWRRLGFSFSADVLPGGNPPYSHWFLAIPLWCPIVLFAAYPTIAFIRGPVRRRRRRKRGLCVKCGYDLTGNVTGVCSECGGQYESKTA